MHCPFRNDGLQSFDAGPGAALYAGRPMYLACLSQGKIGAIASEWTEVQELQVNPRSDKLKWIIDERC